MSCDFENSGINDFDCNDICRLCLKREGEMSPIFSRPSDVKSISIPYRIMAFTSIKLETGDGLPGLICNSCLFNVERVYEFKQQCEQADAFLRKIFPSNSFERVKWKQENNKFCNSNCFNGLNNDVLIKPKLEEDIDGVIRSPLKQEPGGKNNIESVVMVVDPNAETLDAHVSDNDNRTGNSDDERTEIFRKIEEKDGEIDNNWLQNATVNIFNQHMKELKSHSLRCPSCYKPFVEHHLLERHKMVHNQEPFFPCDYCESVFNDRNSLKSHWRDHAGLGKLTCMTCGEAFSERFDLDQHMSIHDVLKPYHCIICNKAFGSRSDLRKHTIIHTGARPYVCEVCGKSFTRSTNLNKHARSHSGNRPFDCPECPKKFSTRADLTRHAVTHTGEKPYKCSVCGLAFSRRDKLSRHIKLHEKNDRPFFCEDCGLSFNNRKMLASHFEIHHKDSELPKEIKNSHYCEINSKLNNISIMRSLLSINNSIAAKVDAENLVINIDPFHVNSLNNSEIEIIKKSQ